MLETQTTFAKRRNVTIVTVARWKAAGYLVMVDGKVDVEKSNAKVDSRPSTQRRDRGVQFERLKAIAEGDAASKLPLKVDEKSQFSLIEAHRIKENYTAKLKQLEYDKESGLVVESALAAKVLAGLLNIVRGKILGLGVRLAPTLVFIDDPEVMRAAIDGEVLQILGELSGGGGEIREDEIQKRFSAG